MYLAHKYRIIVNNILSASSENEVSANVLSPKVIVLTNETINQGPQPFAFLSEYLKSKQLLTWLLGQTPSEEILNGTRKISNATSLLQGSKHNSHLRLFEGENSNLIESHLTETSKLLFKEFKEKHITDYWICPTCDKDVSKGHRKWRCDACLQYFHKKCKIAKQNSYNDSIFYYCSDCFFAE